MPQSSIRRRSFWLDAAERALKTFAQAVVASGVVIEGVALEAFLVWEPWSIGFAAALVSVLTSLGSSKIGSPYDASAI